MRWDDLEIFLAVAEHGSASAAATSIGLNHTTVIRRVAAFEKTHGVKLFDRLATGYRPTAAGSALLQSVRQMDDAASGIRRQLRGQDQSRGGVVRLTTTDSVFCAVLAEHLMRFRERNREIVVDVTMTNLRLDLARLAADVSVRPSRNPPEALIGRRACGLAFGIYSATEPFNSDRSNPAAIERWLGLGNELRNSPVQSWADTHMPEAKIVASADTFVALRELAIAGLGAAVLPCCLGDRSPSLHRIGGPITELETSLWVLTHPDLRSSQRISTLSSFLVRSLRADRELLEGRAHL